MTPPPVIITVYFQPVSTGIYFPFPFSSVSRPEQHRHRTSMEQHHPRKLANKDRWWQVVVVVMPDVLWSDNNNVHEDIYR